MKNVIILVLMLSSLIGYSQEFLRVDTLATDSITGDPILLGVITSDGVPDSYFSGKGVSQIPNLKIIIPGKGAYELFTTPVNVLFDKDKYPEQYNRVAEAIAESYLEILRDTLETFTIDWEAVSGIKIKK